MDDLFPSGAFRRESVLVDLRDALVEGWWRPAHLRLVRIHDPKPRLIACPVVEDRVLHAALVDVISRRFDRSLMPEDFACRPGFGAHRAVLHLQRAMRSHRFAIHLDVRAYFPSIDGGLLGDLVEARLPDGDLMRVLRAVLAQGPPLYQRADVRRFARLTADWPPPLRARQGTTRRFGRRSTRWEPLTSAAASLTYLRVRLRRGLWARWLRTLHFRPLASARGG